VTRNTNTGGVLEQMVLPALARGGYDARTQVTTGTRPGGGPHKVDAIARKDGQTIVVSLKWQQASGTAEQKVPFEVMCLADAVREGLAARAYLVLGGPGWTLREYFTSGALNEHLVHAALVRVVSLETFVALANSGKL
jgi:PD-(D/E)XK nuclease superfamily domain